MASQIRYLNKTRFYFFLEKLASLPDTCYTEPFFFDEIKYSDVYFVVQRLNEPFRFCLFLYKREKLKSSVSMLCYQLELDVEFFSKLLFDETIMKLTDFVEALCSYSSEFNELYLELIENDVSPVA